MRICERCNCEMITEKVMYSVRTSEDLYGESGIYVKNINTRNVGPNAVRLKGKVGSKLEEVIDKMNTENIFLKSSVAVCPKCGKVEEFLEEETLEYMKELLEL